jgi:hypothetical protein
MSVITGRTGADAMLKFTKLMLATLVRYRVKLLAFSDAQWSLGHITASQNTAVHSFVDSLPVFLDAITVLADYTNIR